MKENYSFSSFNKYSYFFISDAISRVMSFDKAPVIICVGSDLVVGDSLGPLIGTMIRKSNIDAFVYGTLENPITANEIPRLNERVRSAHPKSSVLVIDAAVGSADDIGMIRILNHGIKPGLGVNKDLEKIGDCSVIGVVAPKDGGRSLRTTRLNLIYGMAEQISLAISSLIKKQKKSVNY